MSIALDVIRWNSEGLETEEIKENVIGKYSQYGINTEEEFSPQD
ncbi:MAG: hypothetical protein Q7K29_00725 [Thermoleophilia bacterium]|nr:hypothetical protein [Thermoleophilia bacterium]